VKYCYPRLSALDFLAFRLLGPGLGNLLFPWARALVLSQQHGLQRIAPTWPQLKIGTVLRREADPRHYAGLFHAADDELQGAGRLARLCLSRRVPEANAQWAAEGEIVEVTGMAGMFEPLRGRQLLVRDALMQMTREEHKSGTYFDFSDSVSIHVRLGDFKAAVSDAEVRAGQLNVRTPLAWYSHILQGIRSATGRELKVYVFSDGTDDELRPLLKLANCQRLTFGSAVADLLALSRSRLLVASGSTFSMWASYLGRMPVVWHPGQMMQRLYAEGEAVEAEMEDYALQ